MNTTLKFGLAAVVVAVAALVGINYWAGSAVGGPGIEGPSDTAAPSPTAPAISFDAHEGGRLTPGTYFVTVSGHRITFAVPAGWQKNVVPQVLWTPNSEARFGFGTKDNINVDPCRPELGELDPPPGPTAADLASALAGIPGVRATSTDAEVGGYPAAFVSLDVPAAFGDCVPDGGEALLSGDADSGPLEPGVHRYWIVEVGGDRIVISAVARSGALTRQVDAIDAMVQSIRIAAP